MSKHVWVSNIRNDEASLGIDARYKLLDEHGDTSQSITACQLLNDGKSVPAELCPIRIWDASLGKTEDQDFSYPTEMSKGLPDVFLVHGYWIVSERAARIIGQFDLGGGALHPVTEGLFLKDNKTQLPGKYFCWVFGNTKNAFSKDNSKNLRSEKIPGLWSLMPDTPSDNDVAVSQEALEGPDVWLDKMLFKTIFLSGPLGDALDAAGMR